MPRLRLILVAADRLLGAVSTPAEAVEQIVGRWPALQPDGRLFFEGPDHQDPKMIQVRYAHGGEGHHLGRIMVDRGNVSTVLGELRKEQVDG
jgi:hypothetical protein